MARYQDFDSFQLVDVLREKSQTERGLIAKISRETGVVQDRMYKWLDGRGSPGYSDGIKVSRYLGILPKNPESDMNYTKPTTTVRGLTIPSEKPSADLEARVKALEESVQHIKEMLEMIKLLLSK